MDKISIENIKKLCKEESIVENCLMSGEIIEEYPEDYPYCSYLILGLSIKKQNLHVVCGIGNSRLWIITAYFPSIDKWELDCKTRKENK